MDNWLCSETLINLASKITTPLDISVVSQLSFQFLKEFFDKLSENAVKYSNCFASNLESVIAYKTVKKLSKRKLFLLPYLKRDLKESYV